MTPHAQRQTVPVEEVVAAIEEATASLNLCLDLAKAMVRMLSGPPELRVVEGGDDDA